MAKKLLLIGILTAVAYGLAQPILDVASWLNGRAWTVQEPRLLFFWYIVMALAMLVLLYWYWIKKSFTWFKGVAWATGLWLSSWVIVFLAWIPTSSGSALRMDHLWGYALVVAALVGIMEGWERTRS